MVSIVMKARPLALLFFTSVSPLLGASVDERVDRLEGQVTQLQRLVSQMKQGLTSQTAYAAQASENSGRSGYYRVRSGDSFWKIARTLNVSLSSLQAANPRIDPRRLAVGKSIRVPGGAEFRTSLTRSESSPNTRGTSRYRVRQGDILGRISENHGIRLHELMSANPGLNPRRLKVGTVLNIPNQSCQSQHAQEAAPVAQVRKTPVSAPRTEPRKPEARTSPVSSYQGLEARRNPYLAQRGQNRQLALQSSFERAPQPKLVPVPKDSRLSEIAKLHCTTVAQINKLNDVSLSPEQMIRSGSQLYVPSR